MAQQSLGHAALMDATYRYQRVIYDATRRYYLLGRDQLIADLAPARGHRILEIACGTGRNLDLISRRHPGCRLFGLDISGEMLHSARAKLGRRAHLVQADACSFDAMRAFGEAEFDRIILSYSVSMIPDWMAALDTAARHLAKGGQLHVVDFGDLSGLPQWFRRALHRWLAKFHVTPRENLAVALESVAARHGCEVRHGTHFRGYARRGTLIRNG